MNKKWYHSKTLWTNLIGLAVIIISVIFVREDIANEVMTAEASILVVINLILRLITNQGLEK